MINVLLTAFLVVGCADYESPTAPTAPTASRLNAAPSSAAPASASPARRRAAPQPAGVLLSFSLSTTSSHTIRRVQLTFDGREVTTVDQPGGSGQVTLKATVIAAPGPHSIRLVVADQASSPNKYFASGSITTTFRIFDLAPVQGLVKTGEGLEFRVAL
jgi:WD40 repeat protein